MMRLAYLAAFLLAATAAQGATIAPHRAVYDLKLIKSSGEGSFASVAGRLAFEIQGSSCEGWTTSFRMVNRYRPAEGEIRTSDTQSTTFESGDGLDLRYNQKEFMDLKPQSEKKIKVSRATPAADGSGETGDAETRPFTVPAGALFPMQHQINLMDKAASGETRDTSLIYDGSDGEKTFRAITFFGKRKAAGSNARDQTNSVAAPLSKLPSWPLSISYYPTSGDEQDTPTYQVGFDLYENGIATGLVLDYGSFTLGGELKNLEIMKATDCP